jgi:cobalt-zinc-cadmium efflux system outer membrane protein
MQYAMPFCCPRALAPPARSIARIFYQAAAAVVLLGLAAARPACGQTSLTLQQAIRIAQNSPAARIAGSEVNAMQGQLRQAGIRPNPRLFLQSEDLRPWASDYTFSQQTEDYGYISQTLEIDGKRGKRVEVAGAQLRQTEAQRSLQLLQMDGRVASSYWQAVAAGGTVQLLEQDLAAMDEMVQYQKNRVDAGAMRGVDLLRMQIERDKLAIALNAARGQAAVARLNMLTEIGSPLAPDVELSDSIEAIEPVPEVQLSSVLQQRADVAMAREAVAAAQADLKLQKSMGVPDLDVLGGYKRNSANNTLFAGLQIPLPVFNRNQGSVERSQADVQMAQDQLEKTTLMVRDEVAAATATYRQELNTVQTTLPDERQRAKQDLAIMRDAYKSGGVDLLRYLDAERTEVEVEMTALRTLAEFHTSAIQLQIAYGVQP